MTIDRRGAKSRLALAIYLLRWLRLGPARSFTSSNLVGPLFSGLITGNLEAHFCYRFCYRTPKYGLVRVGAVAVSRIEKSPENRTHPHRAERIGMCLCGFHMSFPPLPTSAARMAPCRPARVGEMTRVPFRLDENDRSGPSKRCRARAPRPFRPERHGMVDSEPGARAWCRSPVRHRAARLLASPISADLRTAAAERSC